MNLKKKLERYLRVNLLGPRPSSYEKRIYRGRGLTKVEKHCYKPSPQLSIARHEETPRLTTAVRLLQVRTLARLWDEEKSRMGKMFTSDGGLATHLQ